MRRRKRRWLVVLVASLAAAVYAAWATHSTIERDNAIIAQALKLAQRGTGFTVLGPRTVSPFGLVGEDPQECQKLAASFSIPGCDTRRLVRALYWRNRVRWPLSLPSAPQDGYVAYEGSKYNGHPLARGDTTVSLPAYDRSSHVVLLYIGTLRGPLDGEGWVIAYRDDRGKLKEIDRVLVWVS